MPGPLAGVRVLNVTTVVLGPWALRLASTADVLLHNFRPEPAARLRLDALLASGATAQAP
jgi:crotonobetainyl-CoA:carnitine CoA-transferase CaiB-like acyl-CoA transferase